MPAPTLAQDRLARAQNPNSAAQSTASPGRGRARPTSSGTFSGFGPRAGSSPVSASARGGRGSSAAASSGRGGREAQDDGSGVAACETPLTGEERKAAQNNEMWEDRQRKHKAAMILGNWEMLAWYAVAGDEVSSNRLSSDPFVRKSWLIGPAEYSADATTLPAYDDRSSGCRG